MLTQGTYEVLIWIAKRSGFLTYWAGFFKKKWCPLEFCFFCLYYNNGIITYSRKYKVFFKFGIFVSEPELERIFESK